MVLKLPWAQKWLFSDFEKSNFQLFANFWVTKLKPFSGNLTQSVQNSLNSDLVITNFLEDDFEGALSSKTTVLSVWKGHFSVFCKFFSDEVKTVLWESEEKRSKLFKSKIDHTKLLRKWFSNYLELKNECSERLKRAFLSGFQTFECRSWNPFLEKWGKALKTI